MNAEDALPDDISLTVTGRRLQYALAQVPSAYWPAFLAALLGLPTPRAEPVDESVSANPPASGPTSYPLTQAQARALRMKIDQQTWAIIRKALENAQDGVARVSWAEIRALVSAPNWETFAKGRLGGLHRALRNIVGESSALLFWEADLDEDRKGERQPQALVIDGPAVDALQAVRNFSLAVNAQVKAKAKPKVKPKPAAQGPAKPRPKGPRG